MNCVNRSHPDFKNLQKETGLKPPILAARIGVWMDKHTNTRFPSAAELEVIPLTADVFYQTDPIKQLGMRYNMNNAGFMPPNVNLAQVQREARNYGLSVVRAKTGSWYLKDARGRKINPFSYKQLESGNAQMPIKQLTEKLLNWADLHGIEVTTMEEMMKRFSASKNIEEGAVAMADLLNKMIGINPDSQKVDTLAEEIAHFATAILKDTPSVKKAMEKITETKTYEEVKTAYEGIYTQEEDFKKEAVDNFMDELEEEVCDLSFEDRKKKSNKIQLVSVAWAGDTQVKKDGSNSK